MIEKFKNHSLTGKIKITMDDTKGIWIGDKSEIVRAIVSICEQYHDAGDSLTLRQLYYQLVSQNVIPNHDKVYKKISSIKDDVVFSGLVDWDVFEDRGRVPKIAYFEHDVQNALIRTRDWYKLDKQRGQNVHVEVWTEKDAISAILQRVTDEYTCRLVVNKGYSSSTAMYEAYKRFMSAIYEGKRVVILYFGDHDPSGLDMVRDIYDRLIYMMFNGNRNGSIRLEKLCDDWYFPDGDRSEASDVSFNAFKKFDDPNDNSDNSIWVTDQDTGDKTIRQVRLYIKAHFEIVHVGLTKKQIELYKPPPNPAKITDPRAAGYIKLHGNVSWEVDALTPAIMRTIIDDAIKEQINMDVYGEMIDQEKREIDQISDIIDKLETDNF